VTTKQTVFLLFISVLLMASCSSDSSRFRLEGKFRSINQAEFYIYDSEKGTKDTIHVQRGRFVYEKTLEDTATLALIFPNYSTIPIFATPGAELSMKGSASHLRETEVEGTEENEDMTAFRLKANQLTPPEVKEAARQYITEQPASIVSQYLLQTYFLQALTPDYKGAAELCNIMRKADPTNARLAILHKQLREQNACDVGGKLPVFVVLDTKGKPRTNKDLQKKLNVICIFATWSYESQQIMKTAQQLQRKHPKEIALMGINIDANMRDYNIRIKSDTITCPIICDGNMWQSPLARKMGLTIMPSNIIADKHGKVLKRNIKDAKSLKEEIEKLLK
jgi:hypothetical protein